MTTLGIKTSKGEFLAYYTEAGLARLDFPGGKKKKPASTASKPAQRWHALAVRAVESALEGKTVKTMPPIDLRDGTAFQKKVWAALRRIPSGKTATYAQVAATVGNPKASRAVGSACGANPIPLLIPCHRVLATGGGLGGFSGGLHWKKALLAREKRGDS